VRVGLLLCGDLPDRYSAIRGDYPTLVSNMFNDGDLSIDVFPAHNRILPEDPVAFDGFIISGSASSVYEDEPWMRGLEEWLRRAAKSDIPVFGICFGHQILAQAFGGTVERAEVGWGVGVHSMRVLEHRGWMAPDTDVLNLVMTHQDQVIDLPAGAVLLGSSDHCENYLIEFTPNVIGIQGHPEFPAPFARVVYEEKREHIGSLADDAIASLEIRSDTPLVARWVTNLFS
jgi:GMP synthase-like glutamine amidotransferase